MKIKIFSVFYLFFAFVLIYFIIVPFFVLNNPDIQLAYYFPRNNESFGGASILMINNAIFFLTIFSISYLLFSKSIKLNKVFQVTLFEVNNFRIFNTLTVTKLLLIVYASIGILFYFFYKGIGKLSLLGSDTDAWEYRMIGFDDTPTLIKLLLESSRRIILPYLLINQLVNSRINKKFNIKSSSDNYLLFYFIFLYLISIISTFDRAPLMTLIILFAYSIFFMDYSKKKLFYGAFIFIFFIIFFGAVTTFVQYNKTEFSSIDIFLVGINFIFQRVLIDPSLTAIQLVYETFLFGSDKLYFRYSRLGFLFGQNYVGTETDNSLFVAPVGFIADTWRNVGSFGLGIVGIILGYIVFYADSRIKNMETLNAFVVVYLFIATIMFLVYGVLFSMGAFSQLIFLLLVLKSKKYNNSKISLQ